MITKSYQRASISYIVPCHNSWSCMNKCLDSFERQTVLPYEIIIIDDCSTDDTFNQLINYKNNSKLNIILQKNETNLGPSLSRKKGIELSTGEFVAFSDSDDWLELNANELLIDAITNSPNKDVFLYDYYIAFPNGKRYKNRQTQKLISCSKNELIAKTNTSLCCSCFKKKMVSNIIFPNLKHEEDAIVLFQLLKNSSSFKVLPYHLYNYFFRKDSLSKKTSKTLYLEEIQAFEEEKKILQKDFPNEIEFLGIRLVVYSASLYAFRANIRFCEIRLFNKNFNREFPNWKNNKYISNFDFWKRLFVRMVRYNLYISAFCAAKFHHLMYRVKRFLGK